MQKLAKFINDAPSQPEALEFVAVPTLKDENGEPVMWKFRRLRPREREALIADHYDTLKKLNGYLRAGELFAKIIERTCVFPDLRANALFELYNLYDDTKASTIDLIFEIFANPEHFGNAIKQLDEFNDILAKQTNAVEEAKN